MFAQPKTPAFYTLDDVVLKQVPLVVGSVSGQPRLRHDGFNVFVRSFLSNGHGLSAR